MVLMIWDDESGRHRHELNPEGTQIGRSSSCDIHVNHSSVSRQHAEITFENHAWIVRDLGSSNGTRRNGILLTAEEIHDGDELLVGVVPARIVWQEGPVVPLERQTFNPETVILPENILAEPVVHPEAGAADLTTALAAITQALLQETSEFSLLECAAEQILQCLPVAGVTILLHEAGDDDLIAKIVRRRNDAAESVSLPSEVVRCAFLNGEALLIPQLVGDDDEDPMRSAMCVPMIGSDAPIGAIAADWLPGDVGIGTQHLRGLTLIAGVIAGVTERLRTRSADVRQATVSERLLRHHAPAHVDDLVTNPAAAGHLALTRCKATLVMIEIDSFTALADDAPPKEIALVLNRLLAALTEDIHAFGGTLGTVSVPSMMAVFGAPWDQEQHALAAVQCAWRLQETVARLNREGRLGRHTIALRIAVHTGSVLAGDVGSSRRMDYTVLGSTVTVVSRLLAQVSGPGKIILGPETYPAVRDHVVCDRLGLQLLQGIHEPVWAYVLTSLQEV